MKKILMTFIIMIVLLLGGITTVQAAGFDVKITPDSTTLKRGDTVKVMIEAENLDLNPNRGLVTFEGVLDFDKKVFNELEQTKDVQNFKTQELWYLGGYTQENGIIGLAYNSGEYNLEDTKIVEITFKVKDNAPLGSTTISLKDIKGTDGDVFVSANTQNVSTVLTIADKSVGGNTGNGEGNGNGGNSGSGNSNSGDNSGNGSEQPSVTIKPKVTASQEKVANGIKVTLTSNSELAATDGWTLSADKKQLSKVYTADFTGTITIKDANGIESDPIPLDVKLGNSETPNNPGNSETPGTTEDKTPPTATVKYTKGTNGVTVTVTANEELKPLDGWTLSADKKTLTRLYTADFKGTITIQDLAGNKSTEIKIEVDVDGNNGGSQSKDPLPKTGAGYIIPVIALVAIIGTGAFIRYKSMEY